MLLLLALLVILVLVRERQSQKEINLMLVRERVRERQSQKDGTGALSPVQNDVVTAGRSADGDRERDAVRLDGRHAGVFGSGGS